MPSEETIREARIWGLVDMILDPDTHSIDRTVCLAQLEQIDLKTYFKLVHKLAEEK